MSLQVPRPRIARPVSQGYTGDFKIKDFMTGMNYYITT